MKEILKKLKNKKCIKKKQNSKQWQIKLSQTEFISRGIAIFALILIFFIGRSIIFILLLLFLFSVVFIYFFFGGNSLARFFFIIQLYAVVVVIVIQQMHKFHSFSVKNSFCLFLLEFSSAPIRFGLCQNNNSPVNFTTQPTI